MAIQKGKRFEIGMDEAFPKGLVLNGDVEEGREFQSQEDRDRGRTAQPLVDEQTGKRIWKATVTDPDEAKAKRASFEVFLTADVQPVPPTEEVLPGMRPIALEGLQAEPRLGGQDKFRYQSYQFWATGLADPKATPRSTGKASVGSAGSAAQGKEQAA